MPDSMSIQNVNIACNLLPRRHEQSSVWSCEFVVGSWLIGSWLMGSCSWLSASLFCHGVWLRQPQQRLPLL